LEGGWVGGVDCTSQIAEERKIAKPFFFARSTPAPVCDIILNVSSCTIEDKGCQRGEKAKN